MIKNVAIGQYYNTKSPIHSLDPRTKLISLVALMVTIFLLKSPVEYAFFALFTAVCIFLSHVPFGYIVKGLKPVWLLITVTAIINLFFGSGETVLWQWKFLVITREALVLAVNMFARVTLLIILSSLLTLTTSPMNLTTGIEKLLRPLEKVKFPSHEVAMMMSIALRFIPTLTNEADKIMKAQTARGNDFEGGGIVKKAQAMIPLFIPLFISAFRRADDLAMAMECRCYRGGKGRTSFKELRYTKADIAAFVIVASVICAVTVYGIVR